MLITIEKHGDNQEVRVEPSPAPAHEWEEEVTPTGAPIYPLVRSLDVLPCPAQGDTGSSMRPQVRRTPCRGTP